MFDPPAKRSSLPSFHVWFMLVVSIGALLGWKFNLFTTPVADRLAESGPSSMDPAESLEWVAIRRDREALSVSASETVPPEQSEKPEDVLTENPLPVPVVSNELMAKLIVPDPSSVASVFPTPAPGAGDPLGNSGVKDGIHPDSTAEPARILLAAAEQVGASPSLESQRIDQQHPLPPGTSSLPGELKSAPPLEITELDRLIQQGDDIAAHRLGSILYWRHPGQRSQFIDRLTRLSGRIYFDPATHYLPPRAVEFGDRLETLAKEHKVSWEYLAKLNRVDPKKIRPGQQLKVIEGPFGVVVDLRDHLLTVHAHGYFVAAFPCGLGSDGRTPPGTYHVRNKVPNPTYYGADGMIAADDPRNPLGEYWLEINDAAGSLQGIGIHGTIEPDSIGTSTSRGCLRLRDADIAALYDLLTVGSEVVIRP